MGKRGSYHGDSPTDRAASLMDKFIQRSDRKRSLDTKHYGRRKSKDTPVHTWPLQDQIEHWNNMTDEDWFRKEYPTYSDWRNAVLKRCGMHPTTFIDVTSNHKSRMEQLYVECVSVAQSIEILQKEGIIH